MSSHISHISSLLSFVLSSILLISCELEVLDNGRMDGNWQLRQIDTLATEGICDMTDSLIYWGVQDELLQVRDIDNSNQRIFFRYHLDADSLTIHSPYWAVTKNELVPVEDIETLRPLGITDTIEYFHIDELNSGTMILKNIVFRLHFRKY